MSGMMRWVRLAVLLRLQLSSRGIITNPDNRASAAQFMLGRAKSPSSAISPRN